MVQTRAQLSELEPMAQSPPSHDLLFNRAMQLTSTNTTDVNITTLLQRRQVIASTINMLNGVTELEEFIQQPIVQQTLPTQQIIELRYRIYRFGISDAINWLTGQPHAYYNQALPRARPFSQAPRRNQGIRGRGRFTQNRPSN